MRVSTQYCDEYDVSPAAAFLAVGAFSLDGGLFLGYSFYHVSKFSGYLAVGYSLMFLLEEIPNTYLFPNFLSTLHVVLAIVLDDGKRGNAYTQVSETSLW